MPDSPSEVATKFSRQFIANNPDILGMLQVGSTTIGVDDSYADIDVFVFANDGDIKTRRSLQKGFNERYEFDGATFSIDWHELEYLSNALQRSDEFKLWSLSNAVILYDPNHKIADILSGLGPHSPELRKRKLFLRFFLLSGEIDNCEKSIRRRMFETAALQIYNCVRLIIQMAFIAENKFVPYEKWAFRELQRLRDSAELTGALRSAMTMHELNSHTLNRSLLLVRKARDNFRKPLVEAGVKENALGAEWWKHKPSLDVLWMVEVPSR